MMTWSMAAAAGRSRLPPRGADAALSAEPPAPSPAHRLEAARRAARALGCSACPPSLSDVIAPCLEAQDPDAIVRSLLASLRPLGAVLVQAADVGPAAEDLQASTDRLAGARLHRASHSDWPRSAGWRRVFVEGEVGAGQAHHRGFTRLSDLASPADAEHEGLWTDLAEVGVAELCCAPARSPGGRIVALHVGLARPPTGAEAHLLRLTLTVVAQHLLNAMTVAWPVPDRAPLTPRELAAMRLVAAGRTDVEIARALGVSDYTARFHVDNARRKLDAANRAHAVARLAALGLL